MKTFEAGDKMKKYDLTKLGPLLEEARTEFKGYLREISDIFEVQLGIIEILGKEIVELQSR